MPIEPPFPGWEAVVVAGGRGSRLGGSEKARWTIGGVTLVDRMLDATRAARRVALVGPPRLAIETDRVLVVREDPPFGGPAAALGAGVSALAGVGDRPARWTLVLPVDLVDPAGMVAALLDTVSAGGPGMLGDGAIAVDDDGRRQWLATVVATASIRRAVLSHPAPTGAAVRRLLGALDLAEVRVPSSICADVDTLDDAARHGVEAPRPSPGPD